MPDESEVIQSDVYVDFPLPNGKTLPGKPVAYPDARKIMASMHAYDRTGDYEGTLEPALAKFEELTGLTETKVLELCPGMSLGELTTAIQRFFFQRRPKGNGAAGKTPTSAPAAGA